MFSFDTAVARLQTTFGEDVVYHRGVLAPVTINAVYRQPIEEGFVGNSSLLTQVTVFEIAVTALAGPGVGDLLIRPNGERFVVQSSPTKDEASTIWLLDVRAADAP